MASTFSTDLKLELMATGENAGTWGDKTNTNLNLVQQAIAGVESIALTDGGTVTLVMSDASISNARNMVLKLTGTLTGASELHVPDSIEKFYIIDATSVTGATNLTIETVSGTGFTLDQAKIYACYSDGTNIIEVSLDTLGGVIGTASIADNSITTAKISDNQITASKISANTILGSNINTTTDVQIDSLGIGTAASGTTGEIRATNDVTAFYSSDVALKENIINIPNPLEAIKKLNGVLFDWKKSYIDQKGGEDGYFVRKKDVGVIAQEVEKVLPEAVAQRPDGIKAVKYDRLTCLLIEAVKVLTDKVEKLTQEKK
jgi:hypothetical protein